MATRTFQYTTSITADINVAYKLLLFFAVGRGKNWSQYYLYYLSLYHYGTNNHSLYAHPNVTETLWHTDN